MKIIVTGCKGQLGTEIIKQLREGRSEIGPIPEKLMNATVIPVDLPELDISNYKMVDDFIRRQRPDVIINCAAYTNVDGCEVNHDAAFKANALGPRNLAQAAEKTGARLVHVSTDYVFSGRENGGIAQDEATIPGPISAYGSTKLMGEKYVEQFCQPLYRPHGMAVQLLRQELRQDHRQRRPEIRQAGSGQRPVRQPHQRG